MAGAVLWRVDFVAGTSLWVKSLSLWRGAHFEKAKRTLGWVKPLSLWRGAHFEKAKRTLVWVKPLSLWRGAHFEKAKRTLCALRAGHSCCGAVRVLSAQSEPSAHFGWVELILLSRGAHVEIAQ